MQTALLGVFALCCCVCAVTAQFTITVPERLITMEDGETAVFTVKPSSLVASGSWHFGDASIGVWVGTSFGASPQYQGRVEVIFPEAILKLKGINLTDSGDYIVRMVSVDGIEKTETITLTVLKKITSVNITANNHKPIEYNDTVTMACAVTGTVESQLWFKDEQALHSSDRITISVDNDTLTIINVTRNDGGTYQCEARNTLSSQSGSHTLSIAYGPDVPELTIAGTHPAELGDSLALSCSAQSHPEAQYKWRFNGTILSHTTPQITIDKISQTDLGIYTCQAHNSVTLRDNETTLNVMLNDKSKNTNGLSGGAIAGIVIACIVVVALIVALAVWFVKEKGREKSGSNHQNGVTMDATGNTLQQSSRGANTATANRDHEIVYAQPQLLQGHPTAPMTAIVDNKTDYAELKFK